MAKWRKLNPIKIKESKSKWRKSHPEYESKYYKENAHKVKEKNKRWAKKHPQKNRERFSRWKKTVKGKKYSADTQDRRKRTLGNEYLNEWFKGCNRHHINNKQIVCIPAELHKKYPHNHNKPETMEDINRISMQYLFNCKA